MFRPTRSQLVVLLTVLGLTAGCTSTTDVLDTAKATPPPAPVASENANKSDNTDKAAKSEDSAKTVKVDKPDAAPAENIIHQKPTVTQKGNYIVALVNGEPITNYDVQRRKKFLRLRRKKPSTDAAIAELVDERLKLQVARKKGKRASDSEVAAAFAKFAKSNRSTPARIAHDLDRIGVGADHFKEFIRAQISWNRTVGYELQAETRQKVQKEALFDLRKSGSEKPETTEYTLKQIIFVIPSDKRKKLMKSRKAEATAFAQRFEGCDKALDMAKQLRDVVVKDLGRLMLPELPADWSDDIQKTPIDKTTQPHETDKGVELLAVCNARVVSDDRAAQIVSQSNAFDSLEKKGDAAADELLAKLRKSAVIIYK